MLVTVPDWVNDLEELKFGHGYWINVSRSITLHLSSGTEASQQSMINDSQSAMPLPPATFYGTVLAGNNFTPAAGMKITAWIDGHICGQARTMEVDGQVVYAINVLAEDAAVAAGCGAQGREVTFHAGTQTMATTVIWDNNRVRAVALDPELRPAWRVYLPLIIKR